MMRHPAHPPLSLRLRGSNAARRCDCGRIAVRAVMVEVFGPDGHGKRLRMFLCAACYQEHLTVELSLAQARRQSDLAHAIEQELSPC